jgi:hypothetical protein
MKGCNGRGWPVPKGHRKKMPIVLLSTASLDDETKALARKESLVECALKTADLSELVSRAIVADD